MFFNYIKITGKCLMIFFKKRLIAIFLFLILLLLFSNSCYSDVIYCFPENYSIHKQDGLKSSWQKVNIDQGSVPLFLGKKGHRKTNEIVINWNFDRSLKGKSVSYARLKIMSQGGEFFSHLNLSVLPLTSDGLELLSSNPVFWTIEKPWKKSNLKHPLHYFSPNLSSIINQVLKNDLQQGQDGHQISLKLIVSNSDSASSKNEYFLFSQLVVLEIYEDLYDTFLGKEMLGKPTGTSIDLTMLSLLKLDFYVEYGESPGEYQWAAGRAFTSLPLYDPIRNSIPLEPITVHLKGLFPSRRYYYRIRYRVANKGEFETGQERSFKTRKNRGEGFTFIVTADSHIGGLSKKAKVSLITKNGGDELLLRTHENIFKEDADLYITLGDEGMTDYAKSRGDAFYRYSGWRWFYDKVCHSTPLFYVMGNHDGELSWQPKNAQLGSRKARLTYTLNPDNKTYPQGGHEYGNYYAFSWGDALFVVLDPFIDTGRLNPEYTWYILKYLGGGWTLGGKQFAWLQQVLEDSQENYKFIFMHHILASWERNGYGRGGAKYAYKNNQKKLQNLMQKYGVQILFYGHDHVFSDGLAGGVHYTCCGQPSSHKGVPPWARTDGSANRDFNDAYPYSYIAEKGYVKVSVRNDCTRVSYIKSDWDETNGKELVFYTVNPNKIKVR